MKLDKNTAQDIGAFVGLGASALGAGYADLQHTKSVSKKEREAKEEADKKKAEEKQKKDAEDKKKKEQEKKAKEEKAKKDAEDKKKRDEAAAKKAKGPARKTQTLEKKKNKDKKMKEDKLHRIRLAEAATFLPMRSSKKATVTEQLVAGLQNALGGPSVNATTKCRQELDNLQKHLSVLMKIHESGQKLLRDAADDEDKGWAQEQQRVSRGTI
jgi:flagellar biosynthesis GTPase FlhF